MNMAKNQDLPLNPAKVSGVCGRLLCCLSYENDQYRQMKAVMPKLGQPIETPGGMGQVVSMQLLKELVTVRLESDNVEATFRCDELGLGTGRPQTNVLVEIAAPVPVVTEQDESEPAVTPKGDDPAADTNRRRRRRRSGRRASSTG
jgi:cell fate regulator YaaT (PSP1 superfamily)